MLTQHARYSEDNGPHAVRICAASAVWDLRCYTDFRLQVVAAAAAITDVLRPGSKSLVSGGPWAFAGTMSSCSSLLFASFGIQNAHACGLQPMLSVWWKFPFDRQSLFLCI